MKEQGKHVEESKELQVPREEEVEMEDEKLALLPMGCRLFLAEIHSKPRQGGDGLYRFVADKDASQRVKLQPGLLRFPTMN